MKIETFKVERWMNDYEDDAIYNLGETCIDSLTIGELLELSGVDPDKYLTGLKDKRLTYSHIFGSPEYVGGVASLYKDLKGENVIPTHGAIGANHMVINALVESTDNMVCVLPTYQQHYSIPRAIGADVRILKLRLENDYLPDLDELRSLVDKNTKMITINNPNNPTGSWIPRETLEAIRDIAAEADAYVLSDEVYRGISEDGSYMDSIVDIYEKGISVGSMSKIFSLAGLRMGMIDDMLASLALANKEKIFERNRAILKKNRQILDDWVNSTPQVHYLRPVAGTTALVYYDLDMPSYELCKRLIKEKGLLFTPGAAFEMEGAVRIGYAFDSKLLKEGLDKFTEFLEEESK